MLLCSMSGLVISSCARSLISPLSAYRHSASTSNRSATRGCFCDRQKTQVLGVAVLTIPMLDEFGKADTCITGFVPPGFGSTVSVCAAATRHQQQSLQNKLVLILCRAADSSSHVGTGISTLQDRAGVASQKQQASLYLALYQAKTTAYVALSANV